ncbi:MAG: DUF3866 family protein [Candidatus Saccharibacteria bacterium]
MIETRIGTVTKLLSVRPGLVELEVEVEGRIGKAVAYIMLTGEPVVGDQVLLNTTATSLKLGSGGYDYVMVNLTDPRRDLAWKGHIMKMRYTPWQCRVLSVEEEESPHRKIMEQADSLNGCPVLVGTLHSMLAPLCACLADRGLSSAYVMTDGASLPMYWSGTVHQLRQAGLLKGTVTTGNAFGGELEAVNIYSGMLAAAAVFKPDVIIVAMGPGIVGTGTSWGFSGIEQGPILDAVDTLGGIPVAVPRVSFADTRDRHQGISHHTLTVLGRVCKSRVKVPLPLLNGAQQKQLQDQIDHHRIAEKHEVIFRDGRHIDHVFERYGLKTTTMGRGRAEDYEFFLTLGAAAQVAADLV